MCYIVMMGRQIAKMFSTFSLWGCLFLMHGCGISVVYLTFNSTTFLAVKSFHILRFHDSIPYSILWWTIRDALHTHAPLWNYLLTVMHNMRNRDPHRENVENVLAICLPIMAMQHIRESPSAIHAIRKSAWNDVHWTYPFQLHARVAKNYDDAD